METTKPEKKPLLRKKAKVIKNPKPEKKEETPKPEKKDEEDVLDILEAQIADSLCVEPPSELEQLRQQLAEMMLENAQLKLVKKKGAQGGSKRKNGKTSATAIYDRDYARIKGGDMNGLEFVRHTVNLDEVETSVWELYYNDMYKVWEVVNSEGTTPIPMLRENHASFQAIATQHLLRCYEAGHTHLCEVTCEKPIKDKKILDYLKANNKPIPNVGDKWDCYGTIKAGKSNPKINWEFIGEGWGA